MINSPTEMKKELREKMRAGTGAVELLHLVDPGSVKNTRLLAELILSPGSSIGPHRHDNETEFYIITEGSGIVEEDDGRKIVKKGDIVITGNGQSHSIENNGVDPLKFLAVIVTE